MTSNPPSSEDTQNKPRTPLYPPYTDPYEVKRLHNQHDFFKRCCWDNRLILIPPSPHFNLKKPGLRVLDSGTSDGYFLVDILPELAPDAQCYGVDIAPKQFPVPDSLPSNIHLQQQDIKKPWPAEWTGTFDLIHQRAVLTVASPEERQSVVNNLVALAKPGEGWVQLVEGDVSDLGQDESDPQSALTRWVWIIHSQLNRHGLDKRAGVGMGDLLREAGLVDVEERYREVPLGKGAEGLGKESLDINVEFCLMMLKQIAREPSVQIKVKDGTVYNAEKIIELSARLEVELRTTARAYLPSYAVWGRRP